MAVCELNALAVDLSPIAVANQRIRGQRKVVARCARQVAFPAAERKVWERKEQTLSSLNAFVAVQARPFQTLPGEVKPESEIQLAVLAKREHRVNSTNSALRNQDSSATIAWSSLDALIRR